ncbi:MAG: hypothetical protein ACLFN7_01250 [Candidatus Acetothermia bacterium]
MTEEDASQPLKLAKAGPGARPLAKDTLTSAIKDVLTETDLREEKRSRLQERLIKRTEEELENREGTFREKVEEGSLEEAAKFLIESPRRLDRALSRLESGELSGPSQSELEELAGRVGAGGPSIGPGSGDRCPRWRWSVFACRGPVRASLRYLWSLGAWLPPFALFLSS